MSDNYVYLESAQSLGTGTCGETCHEWANEGYVCTRPLHPGDPLHVAFGIGDQVCHVWETDND